MNEKHPRWDEQNNYIDVLTDTLDSQRELLVKGTTEYALICLLQSSPYHLFDMDCLKQPSGLFKTHFLLFHSLYKLKFRYRDQQLGELEIHSTAIKLNTVSKDVPQPLDIDGQPQEGFLIEGDKLAQYYLDLANLNLSNDEVEALLDSFWQRFAKGSCGGYSASEVSDARRVLNIPDDSEVDESSIKRHYRKALQLHHPDKGGCSQAVQKVIHAYQVLSYHSKN
ncbi:DNA-J related domain-containing protein [Alteromonas sp. D210916BOD_24]|uniref:DNA-J related domain-containing protein n=1 Tax=Alteromonas sp. D210916BOD_24 TaxID=3157618 RepID=UPI00399D0886